MWRSEGSRLRPGLGRIGLGAALLALAAAAQAAPRLEPGEALALRGLDGAVQVYGEAGRETPMGSLAKLVWLAREGDAWEARGATFTCRGAWRGFRCWDRRGHGTVGLREALRASCNLAFLAWASESLAARGRTGGASSARAALEADFAPFLGDRLPESSGLPELTPAWVGDGGLLRTSPEAFAAWLGDPLRAGLRARCARLLPDRGAWWVKTGTGPVPGDPRLTAAWAAGSDGATVAVLRLAQGRGKVEGLARFRALVEDR
jgi:hypothetical protein